MSIFFEKLQQKSNSEKKTILIVSLLILMVFVILIWFFQVKNYSVNLLKEDNEKLAPISDLKEDIIDIYKTSSDSIKEIKETLNQ
ncbi:MAG: hypothetical protein KAR54_00625, partial [Candidatus Pacebacteria bacterium]|nr:hypothetical protein [Candidatus Paceibacterota bacterium]